MLETLLSLWLIFGASSQDNPILSESTQPVELQTQNKAENKNGVRWDKERRSCQSLGNNRYKCEIDLTGTAMKTINEAYAPKGTENISRQGCRIGFTNKDVYDLDPIPFGRRYLFSQFCSVFFRPDYRDEHFSLKQFQKIDGKWYKFRHFHRVILANQEENPNQFLYFATAHTYEPDDYNYTKYNRAIEVFLFTIDNLREIKPGVVTDQGRRLLTLHEPVRISRTIPFLNDHPHGLALWPKRLRTLDAKNDYNFSVGLPEDSFFLLALDSLLIARGAQQNDNMEIIDMSFEPEIDEHIDDGMVVYRYVKKYILSVEFIKR
ncbi:hypothetical protein [Roseofilum sp. Guam]|uniref:hypothetical protein n=1 Tax=Roseofilum sp. Guam TaxID=2821502 RepID=UPI001B256426|nr:hypothetical protein [Roseofilum sp. Guam]MBP0028527.1 hypothetical protein [Roseofilum sp. Guam]